MNLEQVNELMEKLHSIDTGLINLRNILEKRDNFILSVEQFHKMKIDITPICKAISDMTEEISNTIGKETVRASIEKRIDSMIELLDKYVNGDKK